MKLAISSSNQCSRPAATSASGSPSTAPLRRGGTGPTLTNVLERAWKGGFKTKSDFARLAANAVGVAASDGFITTKQAAGLYGSTWFITAAGLQRLNILKGISR